MSSDETFKRLREPTVKGTWNCLTRDEDRCPIFNNEHDCSDDVDPPCDCYGNPDAAQYNPPYPSFYKLWEWNGKK